MLDHCVLHPPGKKLPGDSPYCDTIMKPMQFTKMQGAGNDYVYVNGFQETVRDAPGLARKIADRHFGVDGVRDTDLKRAINSNKEFRSKILRLINGWLNGQLSIPPYLSLGRAIFLSKDRTPFPATGNARVIVVSPALTKLYEHVLLNLLKVEVATKMPLSPMQTGFVEGVNGCANNIFEVITARN